MKSNLTSKSLVWRKGLMCPFCIHTRVTNNFEEHIKKAHPTHWWIHCSMQEWLAHERKI